MAQRTYRKVEFGSRLKTAREMQGLTQKELAKRIGCWQSQIVAWEDGTRKPRGNHIKELAKELKIDPIELFYGKGEAFYKTTKYGRDITIHHLTNNSETALTSNYELLSNDEKHIVNELIEMLVEEKD